MPFSFKGGKCLEMLRGRGLLTSSHLRNIEFLLLHLCDGVSRNTMCVGIARVRKALEMHTVGTG